MARPSKSVPTYRHHKKTGQAVVTVRKADGGRTDIYLGKFNSPESLAEYERILSLIRSNRGTYPDSRSTAKDGSMTVAEVAARFLKEKVEVDYILPNGTPGNEQTSFRLALKPLVRLYGSTLASEFDAERLEHVQTAMATGSWLTLQEQEEYAKAGRILGWCRNHVNRNISRLRLMFRWCVRRKLVPVHVLTDIGTVEPLRVGRGGVRESAKVLPVDINVVEDTIPHLPPVVRDMTKLQLATGSRPGELCRMRIRELEMSGPVWFYRPTHHKTQHHGLERVIAIGPRGQEIIRKYLKPSLEAYVFSPIEQAEILRMEKRARRKSKVQPSQVSRAKPGASRLREKFSVVGYALAIARACKKASVPHWHPNQLRHSAALAIEREHGAEAARAVLGHRTLNMTLHYSGIDAKRAAEVAAKIG